MSDTPEQKGAHAKNETAKASVSFLSRLGEFAIYAALAAGGALVILWLLANT
jgi:hypothetical protein